MFSGFPVWGPNEKHRLSVEAQSCEILGLECAELSYFKFQVGFANPKP